MIMSRAGLKTMLLALLLALALRPEAASAQSGGTGSQDADDAPETAATGEAPGEAYAPPTVHSPECAWIGQRILMLLWRDDIDTAKDFIEIYDRFGCPRGHEGPAFRCLVQVGVNPEEADPGLPERAKACWQDPALDPTTFVAPQTEEAPAQQ